MWESGVYKFLCPGVAQIGRCWNARQGSTLRRKHNGLLPIFDLNHAAETSTMAHEFAKARTESCLVEWTMPAPFPMHPY